MLYINIKHNLHMHESVSDRLICTSLDILQCDPYAQVCRMGKRPTEV